MDIIFVLIIIFPLCIAVIDTASSFIELKKRKRKAKRRQEKLERLCELLGHFEGHSESRCDLCGAKIKE